MTKDKTDEFFEQKLASSECSPSPTVWSKLESQLAQKKKKTMVHWFHRIASTVLLLLFGWLIFKSDTDRSFTEESIAQNNTAQHTDIDAIETKQSKQIGEAVKEVLLAEASGINRKVKTPKKSPKQKVKKSNSPLVIVPKKSTPDINSVSEKKENSSMYKSLSDKETKPNTDEVTALNISTEKTNAPTKERGSLKLVYILKPAIASESTAQTNAEKVIKLPFKKIIALARNIKENPRGIGNLRNFKNNLLTLNKKKNDAK